MAQYDVYWFDEQHVLDCQSDFVDAFNSRLVVPLLPLADSPPAVKRLMPAFDVNGEKLVMATPLASAVLLGGLGRPVTSLAGHADEIGAALDCLITGF